VGYIAGVVDEYESNMLSGLLKTSAGHTSHGELLFTLGCGAGAIGEIKKSLDDSPARLHMPMNLKILSALADAFPRR